LAGVVEGFPIDFAPVAAGAFAAAASAESIVLAM
jgi:hypothetical protein